ncbi:MAG: hypothetical protein E7046_05720 [Lentisphaerae bacterium]|nr:hypothetical protein [Lentisphaerota bacterium]
MIDGEMIKAQLHVLANDDEDSGQGGQYDLGCQQFDDPIAPPIGGDGMQQFVPTYEDEQIKIGPGVVCVGRKHYRINGISAESGEMRLKIVLGGLRTAEITIEKGSGFDDPEEETSYIPLYILGERGEIIEDYRSNFCVVARE